MAVNAFNSKGAFYIIGHKSPSTLEGFMMDILSTDPNISKPIPDEYREPTILAFSKCTKLESI
jgi:hypothetical protein